MHGNCTLTTQIASPATLPNQHARLYSATLACYFRNIGTGSGVPDVIR
jgi:hypothetical protein